MFEINDTTFRQLYDEHFKNLVFFAMKFTHSKEPAEDIVADKFVKLWELRSGFNDARKCKAFLYMSVANASRNYCKYNKRLIHLDFDIEQIEAHEIDMAVVKRVMEEIEKLPPMCKGVFKKRLFDKKPYTLIGQELNIAYGTINTHYTRARNIIKKKVRYG
jgi:RNA polymerase sigma-19 factor, ECF subfamily